MYANTGGYTKKALVSFGEARRRRWCSLRTMLTSPCSPLHPIRKQTFAIAYQGYCVGEYPRSTWHSASPARLLTSAMTLQATLWAPRPSSRTRRPNILVE